jgi:hypothetical protein
MDKEPTYLELIWHTKIKNRIQKRNRFWPEDTAQSSKMRIEK